MHGIYVTGMLLRYFLPSVVPKQFWQLLTVNKSCSQITALKRRRRRREEPRESQTRTVVTVGEMLVLHELQQILWARLFKLLKLLGDVGGVTFPQRYAWIVHGTCHSLRTYCNSGTRLRVDFAWHFTKSLSEMTNVKPAHDHNHCPTPYIWKYSSHSA